LSIYFVNLINASQYFIPCVGSFLHSGPVVAKKVFTILERSPEEAVLTPEDAERWWSLPGVSSSRNKNKPRSADAADANIDAQEAFVRGPAYEKHVLALLKRLRFSVVGTGRAGDGGVDFQGWWLLPDQELRILGQCKNESRQIQPKHIRDFVGSLETRHDQVDYLGLFISRSEFSTAALSVRPVGLTICDHFSDSLVPSVQTAQSSSQPLLLLVYSDGALSHAILNRTARARVPSLVVSRKPSDPSTPMAIELTYFYDDETATSVAGTS
jgi:hypothetical protein